MRVRAFIAVVFAASAVLVIAPSPAAEKLQMEPAAPVFPETCVNRKSESSHTLKNMDSNPVDFNLSLEQGDNDFALSGVTSGTIPVGGSVTFKITFAPAATGSRSATLHFNASPNSADPGDVVFSAEGVTRDIVFTPASLVFGEQRVGLGATEKPVVLTNNGSDSLIISKAAINVTDFRLHGLGPTTVPPGGTRNFSVGFQPRAAGKRNGTLTVTSPNACAGTTKTMGLTGTGIAPAIRIDPAVLDLGQVPIGQPSERVPLVVSNDGKAPLRVSQIQIVGADSTDFAFEALPTLPRTVAAGDSFLLNVIFTPSGAGTLRAGARVTSDDPKRPIFEATLTGIGGGASIPPTTSPTATPTPTDTASPTSTPRASAPGGGGGGDWVAVVLVVALVIGAFAGLMVLKRVRAEQG